MLRKAGLEEADIARIARPIPAMRVETAAGTSFRLTYGDDGRFVASAVGFDRSALDPLLVDLAAASGVVVRLGETVTSVEEGRVMLAGGVSIRAAIIVGADGLRSVVARSFGVDRPARLAAARRPHVPCRRSETGRTR